MSTVISPTLRNVLWLIFDVMLGLTSDCSEINSLVRTERKCSFNKLFLCFPFLGVREELVEMNWDLLARRRRDKYNSSSFIPFVWRSCEFLKFKKEKPWSLSSSSSFSSLSPSLPKENQQIRQEKQTWRDNI